MIQEKRDGIQRLLTPLELRQLAKLNMVSRFTVEGQLQGSHPSPLKGFNVEFSDYRPYVPGDDIRHLDWRVFARNERLYLRQYEEECNLRTYLILDGSLSMNYRYIGTLTKYQYASKLCGALAYITIFQHDNVGLYLCNGDQIYSLPARGGYSHLTKLANLIADHTPKGSIDLATIIHRVTEQIQRRALIIILSDCFSDLEPFKQSLAHLKRRKHDIIIYQILDKAEIEFPFQEFGRFYDMETRTSLLTNPQYIRDSYLEVFQSFLQKLRGICVSLDIDYQKIETQQNPIRFICRHLYHRMG